MRKSRFNETQILGILKEYEGGIQAQEICRKYSINRNTLYNWKTKYSGMTSSEIKKLRHLEEENNKLKRMYADVSLENTALKDLLSKKW